jgi:hypothetical protein
MSIKRSMFSLSILGVVIADSTIRASLHLPKGCWASLRRTFRCLFANNAFEWIEQLLAVQDVAITRPRSRGESPRIFIGRSYA